MLDTGQGAIKLMLHVVYTVTPIKIKVIYKSI